MKTDTTHTEHAEQFRKTDQNHMNNYDETYKTHWWTIQNAQKKKRNTYEATYEKHVRGSITFPDDIIIKTFMEF
jgi:uncharacterized iron-regulated protein